MYLLPASNALSIVQVKGSSFPLFKSKVSTRDLTELGNRIASLKVPDSVVNNVISDLSAPHISVPLERLKVAFIG